MISLRRTEDIGELMQWREEVIRHVFGMVPGEKLLKANEEYYRSHVPSGEHIAFIAEINGTNAGCGSLCLSEELPSPDNPDGRCGYLMNIYVREEYRTHGVGHAVVRKLIEEAKNRGCGKIYLETTSDGRKLYESMGFADLPDMMKLHGYADS